jgi:hypothetical protein
LDHFLEPPGEPGCIVGVEGLQASSGRRRVSYARISGARRQKLVENEAEQLARRLVGRAGTLVEAELREMVELGFPRFRHVIQLLRVFFAEPIRLDAVA